MNSILRAGCLSDCTVFFMIGQRTRRTSFDDLRYCFIRGQIGLAPRLPAADKKITFCSTALSNMNAKFAVPFDVDLFARVFDSKLIAHDTDPVLYRKGQQYNSRAATRSVADLPPETNAVPWVTLKKRQSS